MSAKRGTDPEHERELSKPALVASFIALGLVFVLDLSSPLGLAITLLYLPIVLSSFLIGSSRVMVAVVGTAIVLNLIGAWLSPASPTGVTRTLALGNRAVIGLVLFGVGAIGFVILKTRRDLERANWQAARTRVMLEDQARALALAGEVGQFGGWGIDVRADLVDWSSEVYRIHGVAEGTPITVEEGLGFYLPADRPQIDAAFGRCMKDGTPFDVELRIRRTDGEIRWVSTIGRAERSADGEVCRVFGAFQDVTERKVAELAALESRQNLETLADSLPLVVWSTCREGGLDYYSQGLAEYTGAAPEELLGEGWVDFVHHDDRARTQEAWTRAVEDNARYTVEMRLRRHDGEYRWHLNSADPVRDDNDDIVKWWGSSVDIEEARAFERERLALAQRVTDTLESIGDAVVAVDQHWTITLVNANAERITELPRSELIGRNLWQLFPEAVDTVFHERFVQAVDDREPTRFEARFEPRKLDLDVGAFPHDQGLTIYFRDVTDERAIAEQLAHSQRLDSLGQLTGGVAHDFNNLLTVMLGNAEMLADELAEQPSMRRSAETIARASRTGADLTYSLLTFARKQPLHPSAFDVNSMVLELRSMLARTLPDSIEVRTVLREDGARCLVDRSQLQNALLNLCLNARDAMPRGGRLTLETSTTSLDESYAAAHMEVEAGEYAVVTITDEGEGIEPEHLDRVYEPFFTTKGQGSGSGLGLAMVYGFVKQSKGHVSLYSEPGQGTTVRLFLPLDPAETPDPVGSPEALEEATGAGETVLLVEDDASVRRVARNHLQALGYRVVEATSGPEALTRLESAERVDLLFSDIVMPGGMSGDELAVKAHSVRPSLRVLLTSGYPRGSAGGDRLDPEVKILGKPYGRAELALNIRRALDDDSTNGAGA